MVVVFLFCDAHDVFIYCYCALVFIDVIIFGLSFLV